MTEYPYTSGDLLEQRNTYFYSRYGGRPFLSAWRLQRDTVARQVSNATSQPHTLVKPTDCMLDFLRRAISDDKIDASIRKTLDRLLQRFEVTKRLHGEYNADWRPVDPADYVCPARYIRFAEVMDLAYGRTSKLQFLNGLLKCMDTLTAMTGKLDASQLERVCQLIVRECDYVECLSLRINKPVL